MMQEHEDRRAIVTASMDKVFAELVQLKIQNEALMTMVGEAYLEGWNDGRKSINGSQLHYWHNSRSRRKLKELT